jgi:hypothetical protein
MGLQDGRGNVAKLAKKLPKTKSQPTFVALSTANQGPAHMLGQQDMLIKSQADALEKTKSLPGANVTKKLEMGSCRLRYRTLRHSW